MIRTHAPLASLVLAVAVAIAVAAPPASRAEPPATSSRPTLDDYRRFRTLSIDLVGRAPTRAEIAEMESPGFDLDRWIDKHLEGPAYVERLERIYMDQLRLEVGPAVQVTPQPTTLHRQTILGPDKKPVYVYYRFNQRRPRPETDGEFCLTQAESGQLFPNGQPPRGTAAPVTQKVLDAATVVVKPWWLYKDYKSSTPKLRYGIDWGGAESGFALIKEMTFEPDGTTPSSSIRICKEEAQTKDTGHIVVTGRAPPPKGEPPPKDRLRAPPGDETYAKQHKGEEVSCRGLTGTQMTFECGCGVGLEHCIPGDNFGNDPKAFSLPVHYPLGANAPFDDQPQTTSGWARFWWGLEGRRFMDRLFGEDRDFREMLTARWTHVNGPLAEFYRSGTRASCCGRERAFKMVEESAPLFLESALPKDLAPVDLATWDLVEDRGPRSAGILTMPVFLAKYASRRARGAAVYQAFLCKSFTSDHADLMPSTEPNLMLREGCSTCHATLEPLAAYFSRVEETSWVFLPQEEFPTDNPVCKVNGEGKMPGFCQFFYDPAFSNKTAGKLRGAYASPEHAARGPAGLAADVVSQPAFAQCAVERVASSFLGHAARDDDQKLLAELTKKFTASGYRMKALVGALVRSPAYKAANDDAPALRRGELK